MSVHTSGCSFACHQRGYSSAKTQRLAQCTFKYTKKPTLKNSEFVLYNINSFLFVFFYIVVLNLYNLK